MPFKRKERDSNGSEDWWFASIGVPLLAATIGPFANVLSIAALVSYWREDLSDGSGSTPLSQLFGNSIKDPHWATGINVASLVAGYAGNFFLFCNFTQRIRYLVALPATIILWFIASLFLTGITIGMAVTCPPTGQQSYTQAYWYAVIAAVLYFLCSLLLLFNLLGFFLGHYGSHFVLTDAQRTLILQTFLFFIWLAGGAGVYTRLEPGWGFSNALYFCDVTILTIGFGDLVPSNNVGRGIAIPYALGGIVFLGLVISSLSNFVADLAEAKIVRARYDRRRARTFERSNDIEEAVKSGKLGSLMPVRRRIATFSFDHRPHSFPLVRIIKKERPAQRKRRLSLQLLKDEEDRFHAMRRIQEHVGRFKRYTTLATSLTAFVGLWVVGAIVFWQIEKHTDSSINSFYDGFYFCYISLLTIGYGDFTPVSSAGRPFFVAWSLFAVPTVTLLIGAAGNTIVDTFNKGTNRVADFTLLPKTGLWRDILDHHPWLRSQLEKRAAKKARQERIEEGFPVGPDPTELEPNFVPPTLDELVEEDKQPPSKHELARRLAHAIRHVADDMKQNPHKRYDYPEWVEFTQLIRFTSSMADKDADNDDELGPINWDWIGEDSPMMAEQTEPEWLLDRLSESMVRYIKYQAPISERKEIVRRSSGRSPSSDDDDDMPPGRRVIFRIQSRDVGQREDANAEGINSAGGYVLDEK